MNTQKEKEKIKKRIVNEETLRVQLINHEKVLEILRKSILIKKNEILRTYTGAIVPVPLNLIEVDKDCCYSFLNNKFIVQQGVKLCLSVPVFIDVKTETGRNISCSPMCYFDISYETLPVLETVSLKYFMGSRYNYNPRIIKNMRDFIANYKKLIN